MKDVISFFSGGDGATMGVDGTMGVDATMGVGGTMGSGAVGAGGTGGACITIGPCGATDDERTGAGTNGGRSSGMAGAAGGNSGGKGKNTIGCVCLARLRGAAPSARLARCLRLHGPHIESYWLWPALWNSLRDRTVLHLLH